MKEKKPKKKRKQPSNTEILYAIGAVILIIALILAFVITVGNYPKVQSPLSKYDEIDFKKLSTDLLNEIEKRQSRLKKILALKEKVMKIVNVAIVVAKISILLLWIGFNIIVFLHCKTYSISDFLDWNEALTIFLLFSLFMISEKYTSLHNAFVDLRAYLNRKILLWYHENATDEEQLKKEIYFLEALYYVHPSIVKQN